MFFKKTRPSSETQEQIVGVGESLNGWEKNGSKKSSRHLFSAHLDFPLPPLSAPWSPRMKPL